MKKVLTLFAALGFLTATTFAQSGAVLEPVTSSHNFTKVAQGIPVKHQFTVKNTGTEPLVIEDVKKTCGCTVTEWTKEPIMPGETGTVTAQYNAAKIGYFKKDVTIISNASNSPIKLFLEGTVVKKEELSGAPENKNSFQEN